MITCKFEDQKAVLLRHVTVDALAIKDNKILLVKRSGKSFREPGKYALPGGFLNRDETLEEGIKREVQEETGFEVLEAKLYKVIDNPNRKGEDTQDVDFAYIIKLGEKVTDHDQEVSGIHWYDLKSLPEEKQFAFDHFQIISDYLASNIAQESRI